MRARVKAIVVETRSHRSQVTAGWLGTDTGEKAVPASSPAHRDEVRKLDVLRWRGV
jgi:hypothetical protein